MLSSRSRGKKRGEIRREAKKQRRSSSKEIQIYCRVTGDLNTKMVLINIDVDRLLKLKESVDHNHKVSGSSSDKRNGPRFRTRELEPCSSLSTCSSNGPAMGNAAIIGSNLYVCFCFEILTADLGSESPRYQAIPKPSSYQDGYHILGGDKRMKPKLIALGGLLFYYSGNRSDAPLFFGEVYDPDTRKWAPVDPPPGADMTKCSVRFKASLGEATGEILYYVCDDKTDALDSPYSVYIYHVVSRTWRTIPADGFGNSLPADWTIIGRKAVVKEDDVIGGSTSLYWIDDYDGTLYSFNWVTLQLRQGGHGGGIVGLDQDLWKLLLRSDFAQMSFFHVSAHLFALAWNKNEAKGHATYHITILKVYEDDPFPGMVTGYTLACFEYTYNGSTSLVSDPIPF